VVSRAHVIVAKVVSRFVIRIFHLYFFSNEIKIEKEKGREKLTSNVTSRRSLGVFQEDGGTHFPFPFMKF